jgi:hypothetical protein
LPRVRRGLAIALTVALAACGSGLEGTLAWKGDPLRSSNAVRGTVVNTTSNTMELDPAAMRLLDGDGRKVRARIRVGAGGKVSLPAGETTGVSATWRNGDPTRLDYGAGTLQLPTG